MAGGHGDDPLKPWKWLFVVGGLIILGYYFAHVIPEPGAEGDAAFSPAAEEAAASDRSADSVAIVSSAMAGSWRSDDDPRFIRRFGADGTVADSYEGDPEAAVEGTWTLFTSANPDSDYAGPLSPGVVYVEIVEEGIPLHFSVVTAAGDTLEMVYLDRGGHLSFTRIQ